MALGLPGKKGVISGMRTSCEVVVEINMVRAIKASIPFHISENRVILSSGIDGAIPSQLFRQVINVKTQELLHQADIDYICVYDFECQCEEGTKNLTFNEIIEFPIVVIDVKQKKIIGEYQTYVKPTIHPKLTPFCTELTGITQEQVDGGIPLKEALGQVHTFLEGLGIFNHEFVFMSCGDFDGNQIRREAIHKKLHIPNYMKRWINLKKVFPVHLFDPSRPKATFNTVKDVKKPPVRGMPDMLELSGLELIGRHHSGIDDSRNIAACAIECLKKGNKFT